MFRRILVWKNFAVAQTGLCDALACKNSSTSRLTSAANRVLDSYMQRTIPSRRRLGLSRFATTSIVRSNLERPCSARK